MLSFISIAIVIGEEFKIQNYVIGGDPSENFENQIYVEYPKNVSLVSN